MEPYGVGLTDPLNKSSIFLQLSLNHLGKCYASGHQSMRALTAVRAEEDISWIRLTHQLHPQGAPPSQTGKSNHSLQNPWDKNQ